MTTVKTEAAFTRGPWRVSGALTDAGNPIMGVGGIVIGHATNVPFNEGVAATQEANARLIAAAPDLYEAVEGLLLLVNGREHSSVCRLAEAALRKARGDAPSSKGLMDG